MDGVIIIDKPVDYTSFDVVAVMRRLCGERKIGHTGTLDPMATGVLPLLLGKATRAAPLLVDTGKTYEAAFAFGYETDTQDSTGTVLRRGGEPVSRAALEAALPRFRGEIEQVPPMYSAVRKNGVRLYELARRGIAVDRAPRPVCISRLECLSFDEAAQEGRLLVCCSKGTYIRALCADLAASLNTLGVMTALRRTVAAGFSLTDAITLDEARARASEGRIDERLLPIDRLFDGLPAVRVSDAQARRFLNGGSLNLDRLRLPAETPATQFRVYGGGRFLGLGEPDETALRVLRLFANLSEKGTDSN